MGECSESSTWTGEGFTEDYDIRFCDFVMRSGDVMLSATIAGIEPGQLRSSNLTPMKAEAVALLAATVERAAAATPVDPFPALDPSGPSLDCAAVGGEFAWDERSIREVAGLRPPLTAALIDGDLVERGGVICGTDGVPSSAFGPASISAFVLPGLDWGDQWTGLLREPIPSTVRRARGVGVPASFGCQSIGEQYLECSVRLGSAPAGSS